MTQIKTDKPQRAPGPKGTFFLGSLSAVKQDAIGFLSQSVDKYGDIVRFRFGPITAHLINHPDYIEQVLSRDAENYDKNTHSVQQIRATCGDSLLSANEQAWQRHRKLIQPVFQPRYLEAIDSTIDQSMQPMLERWQKTADNNGSIDIVSEMMHLVISTSANILFGSDVNTALIENSLAIILDDTWRRLQSPLNLSALSDKFHRRKFKQAVAEIDSIIFRIIKDRRNNNITRDDLLSRLLNAHEAEDAEGLTDKELRDAAVTLLLAGHETTANALTWAFYLVAKSPGHKFEETDMNDVFSEAVRMYPSIWIIERRTINDQQIGDYHIPRRSSVLISPYLLHRHKSFWIDAEQFDPGRFSEEKKNSRPRNAYIPFGLGKHRCVGLHMARKVATRVMANVYKQFHLQLVNNDIPEMVPGITLRHLGELRMNIRKHNE